MRIPVIDFDLASTEGNVPACLRERAQWVNWKFVSRSGKATKVPVCPTTGRSAKVNEASSWASFDVALAAYNRDPTLEGIGFVFTPEDPYCGIDLDGCVVDGEISPEAQSIISELASYAETSPSGTGVKVFIRGQKPAGAKCCQKRVAGMKQVEIYDQARFFVVTSCRLPDSPADVSERQQQLDGLCARLWPKAAKTQVPLSEVVASENGAGLAMDERTRRCRRYLDKLPDAIDGQGGHNATLRAACECFRFGLDDTTALQLMSEFNEKKTGGEPWSETELQHKLNDAKRIVSSAGEFGSRVTESRDSGDGINLKFVAQQVTDMGNAARLVLRHGDSIRYSHPHKKWYVWDGRRWQQDHRGKIVLRSKSVALSIFDEAKAADSDERRKRLADWGVASQTRDRLNAMATLAQPDVAIEPSEMDRDPWAFNCLNGTIDLRTGLLRPHRREDLITKLAEVHFDPDAKAPLFAAFLERALGGDQELITFIQRLFGHCLTADVREQYLFVFHGEGGNGKNVLLDTISAIMGDYAAEAPPDLVTTRRNPEHPTEIANLMGQRLVVASETEHGSELRTQLIKRLTGNAWLKARLMRKDFFQFERTHKLILVTNNRPVLREDTEAVWRRIRLVPFNVVVPLEERDPELLQKLKQESSGILAWMVRGCQDWIAHGLAAPHAVMAATSEYRSNSSGIQAFIEQHCVLDPNAWSSAESLCARYLSWCARNRFVPLQGKELGAALRSQRCTDKKRGGVRGWFGIGLRSESLDGMDGMDGMDGRIRLSAL